MNERKHVHDMVTWGGQAHHHPGPRHTRLDCDKMHGYCVDPTCHAVLQPGDNRSLADPRS